MGTIRLKKMKFHAYHGCLEHERKLGNTFLVNLELILDTEKAEVTDDLNDTLNYQSVYDVVREEMNVHSDLIEYLGRRIVDRLMNEFVQLKFIKIEVEKKNPPLGGEVASVSFVLEKWRG